MRGQNAIGGINITASHNPAQYQGLKFSTSDGAPAPPEVTRQIEKNVADLTAQQWNGPGSIVGTFQCKTIDPSPAYFTQMRKLVDLETIGKAKLKVAVEL